MPFTKIPANSCSGELHDSARPLGPGNPADVAPARRNRRRPSRARPCKGRGNPSFADRLLRVFRLLLDSQLLVPPGQVLGGVFERNSRLCELDLEVHASRTKPCSVISDWASIDFHHRCGRAAWTRFASHRGTIRRSIRCADPRADQPMSRRGHPFATRSSN